MQYPEQPFIATHRRFQPRLLAAFALLIVIALSACSSGSQPAATATVAPTAVPPTVAADTPTPATNLTSPTAIGGANASPAASTTATPAASASAGKKAPANANAINGQLMAINGTMWTLKPKTGAPVTVAITPQTAFGTKKKPAAQTDFTVGSQVVIQSQQTGTTVTATRVTLGKKAA